ncbi:hypothetical protein DL96DRAFT_1650865 [Flagelloscypha sp. PMI_526]|nr:hypothetical protein DL96DRAFT_1650865 [Flagelloscypha sp. PMI_526]
MVSMKDLPSEILTHSLQFCDKSTIAYCCLVDTSTRKIALPLLFHSIFIDRSHLKAILTEQFPYLHMVHIMRTRIEDYINIEFTLLVEKLATQFDKHPLKLHVQTKQPTEKHIKAIADALQKIPASSFIIIHTDVSFLDDNLVIQWPAVASSIIRDVRIISGMLAEPAEGDVARPVVDTLRLEVIPAFRQLRQLLNLECLKRLSVTGYSGGSTEELSRYVAPSLEDLLICCSDPSQLNFTDLPMNVFTHADLKFPRLRAVTLQVRATRNSVGSALIHTFSNISSKAPLLERIQIWFHIPDRAGNGEEIINFWLALFRPHSPLLAALDSFAKLSRVEIALHRALQHTVTEGTRILMNRTIMRGLQDRSYTVAFRWELAGYDLWPFFEDEL